MLCKNFPNRKEVRKTNALIRQAHSNSVTPLERLDNLDKYFGVNQGAAKERRKLNQLVFGD